MHSEIYESPNRVQVNRRISNMPLRYRGEDCDIEMIWLVIRAPQGPEEAGTQQKPVMHHHSFFETHMLLQGSQAYQLENGQELVAVILKNSKIAYSGIYSDSEADEFTKRIDEDVVEEKPKTTKTATTKKTSVKTETKQKGGDLPIQKTQVELIKKLYTAEELIPLMKKIGKVKIVELTRP